ncbi:hypothetical protein [Kitasatospora sp. NPDC056273]|uniref:hypothetical protein n=1 Tax=Kitasatospora sp. NPDC056273 TaxID=3345769 RepID=UPI0035E10DDA
MRTAVRCPDCGGTAVRSVGQSLLHGRELRWDAERFCPQCAAVCCDWGQEAAPRDIREALLTTHGPARLRLSAPLTDPAATLAALRVLREGSGLPLRQTRELLDELRDFGLSGTAVEMAYWRVRLAERGVAAETADGFGRAYRYVGPPELWPGDDGGTGTGCGQPVRTAGEFAAWAEDRAERTAAELAEPFTFVVGLGGTLRLAPRRSEHVACAGGELVLSAGEIGFRRSRDGWEVETVGNHSTGYCPDTTSWPAVAAALTLVGLPHPGAFTHAAVFRRCPRCGNCNLVREEHYACAFCDADLPEHWNVDEVALP